MSDTMEKYRNWVLERTYEELQNEKVTIGRLISDTARRIQDLSGRGFSEQMDEEILTLKELKSKMSVILQRMLILREKR